MVSFLKANQSDDFHHRELTMDFPFSPHKVETQVPNIQSQISVPNIFNQMCMNPPQVSNPATNFNSGRETCRKSVDIKWRFHVVPFNPNPFILKDWSLMTY